MVDRDLFPLFDSPYQGFVTGDFAEDAYVLRAWAKMGKPCFLSYSFAKNMGLYGYRIGCFSWILEHKDEAPKVKAAVMKFCRTTYSNPPRMGSEIAKRILRNAEYREEWFKDV